MASREQKIDAKLLDELLKGQDPQKVLTLSQTFSYSHE